MATESRYKIERIIETDPVIKKGLQRGIVNSRALVRYLRDVEDIDSSPDAILGVIRRHYVEKEDAAADNLLKDCKLALRSNRGHLTLEKDPEVTRRVVDFASSLKTSRGENLTILVGMKSLRVIGDREVIVELKDSLRDSGIIEFSSNLAEISVLLSDPAAHGKGVISRITAEVALNDVCLHGVAYVAPEFIMLVDETVAILAYEALSKMFAQESQNC